MKAKNIPIEINLLGVSEGRRYPSGRFLQIAKEIGNTAIIGIDAHAPEQILNKEVVRKAELLCEEFALPLVDGDLLA